MLEAAVREISSVVLGTAVREVSSLVLGAAVRGISSVVLARGRPSVKVTPLLSNLLKEDRISSVIFLGFSFCWSGVPTLFE